MENKIYKLNDDDFKELIFNSLNIKEVLFKLGYTTVGNSWGYSQVKQRMVDLNIPMTSFKGKSALLDKSEKNKLSKEKLFSNKSKHARGVVRKTIIRENLLEYKCAICGLSEWNGKRLSLELDHINGINYDNRLENLRFLCPNCHSQTTTYESRNKQLNESKYEVSEDLEKLILETYKQVNNIRKVSQKLGIREKIVRQVVSSLMKSNQKYVFRYNKDMQEIARFGSISELCKYLINNKEVKTKLLKTCRATFLRNKNNFWLNSFWKVMDA